MLSYRDLDRAIRSLGIPPGLPVIAHASLSAFGELRGGAETLLGALLACQPGVMMPAFTYQTMITPEDGPADNGITYGSQSDANRMAEFWRPDLPADKAMGVTAEALRRHPRAQRSDHPILSFMGINVEGALQAQSLADPLAPIGVMAGWSGWVLLLGVDHTRNTSLHYTEKVAGRKQFTRWALTPQGVRECPGWPGCPDGFEAAAAYLEPVTRRAQLGGAELRAIPLREMIDHILDLLVSDPLALLCERLDCERCNAVRSAVAARPA